MKRNYFLTLSAIFSLQYINIPSKNPVLTRWDAITYKSYQSCIALIRAWVHKQKQQNPDKWFCLASYKNVKHFEVGRLQTLLIRQARCSILNRFLKN